MPQRIVIGRQADFAAPQKPWASMAEAACGTMGAVAVGRMERVAEADPF